MLHSCGHGAQDRRPFGQILTRCWESGAQPATTWEVIERDDGFIGIGDAARYFDPPERWATCERWAVDEAFGRVLDVGCGAGRHAVALKVHGLDVTGIDSSPGAVNVARSRGAAAHRVALADVDASLGSFHSIRLLGNNLGLLGSPETASDVLVALARVAEPDAVLLGSGLNPYETATPAHLAYHQFNRSRGRMAGHTTIRVRDGQVATNWFHYLFVSPNELAGLVDDSPWKVDHIHDDSPNYGVRLRLR